VRHVNVTVVESGMGSMMVRAGRGMWSTTRSERLGTSIVPFSLLPGKLRNLLSIQRRVLCDRRGICEMRRDGETYEGKSKHGR